MNGSRLNPLQQMRLARRKLRLATGKQRAFPMFLPGPRAARFAQAILARYAGRTSPAASAGLVYPAIAPRLIVQQATYSRQVTLALRLALTLLDWSGKPRRAGARTGLYPMFSTEHHVFNQIIASAADSSGWAALPLPLASPPVRPPEVWLRLANVRTLVQLDNRVVQGVGIADRAVQTEQGSQEFSSAEIIRAVQEQGKVALISNWRVVQRLAQRAERVPSVISGSAGIQPGYHPPAAPQAAMTQAAPTVPRVVRRPAPSQDDVETAAPTDVGHHRAPRPATRTAEPASAIPSSLDPFQIQRLADQVVQVIDNRVIAKRERMGRI